MTSGYSESGKYAFLWDLSDEELERLLQQEFAAADDRELDEDYFAAIAEVMKSREKETPEDREEAEAAWKDFQENYVGQSDAYESVPLPETESSTMHQIHHRRRRPRLSRGVRISVIIVVLICVLGGIASATGWFQAIITWTTETFGFTGRGAKQQSELLTDDPYEELRNTLADYTELALVPTWAPEGTQMEKSVRITEGQEKTIIKCSYQYNDRLFLITFCIYEQKPEEYLWDYEKSEQASAYEHNGTEYSIADNKTNCTAIWYQDNVEGMIQGELSYEDLIQMVDSI